MQQEGIQPVSIFKEARNIFNQNSSQFIKLLIFFAPLIFIVQFSGVLLNPYIAGAEAYSRLAGRALLLYLSYVWLKILLNNGNAIAPQKELNLNLLAYMLLSFLLIFGPFFAIDAIEWIAKYAKAPQEITNFILSALGLAAIFAIIRAMFVLVGLVEGKKLSPLQSFHMTGPIYKDLLWDYLRYILPYALFIAIAPHILTRAVMEFNYADYGLSEAITLYILTAPIPLILHPFIMVMGFTAIYAAYAQAQQPKTAVLE